MNDPQAILITIAIGVGVLILVGGVIWGISVHARNQRQTRSGRTGAYTPLPPPLPERRDVPEPEDRSGIRWGNMVEDDVVELEIERICFGNIERDKGYEYTEVNPYSDSLIIKCPVCLIQIDEGDNNAKVCPQCQESYHQHCFELMNNKCPICGYEEC